MPDEPAVSELAFGKIGVGFLTNCYIIGSSVTGEAICIDPCCFFEPQLEKIMQLAADLGVVIKSVVATHGHYDHVVGINEVTAKTGASFLMHPKDLPILSGAHHHAMDVFGREQPVRNPDFYLADGDLVEVAGLQLLVLETPGHTPGSVSLFCPDVNVVFTGDTLFRGEVGITAPGDRETEMRSITETLFRLPDETIVQPGHQKATMIRAERLGNYPVRRWLEDQRSKEE